MRVLPLDDSVFRHLIAKPEPRKPKRNKIPSLGTQVHRTISAQTVAEVRWLSDHSFPTRVILRLYPELNPNSINGLIYRTTRIHVDPAPPAWINADAIPSALKKPERF